MKNRIIKFRAWDKDWNGGEMRDFVLGDMLLSCNENTIIDFDDLPVMQFTGLKDKNGKEIYEGDIIKITATKAHPEWIGVVKWEQVNCGFEISIGKDWMPVETSNEIIGNLFENPDLLK